MARELLCRPSRRFRAAKESSLSGRAPSGEPEHSAHKGVLKRAAPWCALLVLCGLCAQARADEAARAAAFRPDRELSLADLERAVQAGSPAIVAARGAVATSAADARQARLLPNPTVDLGWSTIPI